MKYFIPHAVIASFLEHSVNNFAGSDFGDSDGPIPGRHVETLAFLIGKKDGEDITATDIIFPNQYGTPGHVDDLGKLIQNDMLEMK